MRALPVLLLALGALAGCDNGNIRPTTSYNAPKAPAVRNSSYNPYGPTERPMLPGSHRPITGTAQS